MSRDADESERGVQRNDKWWLPTVKVPSNGLSEESRRFLQKQREAVNQVLKASMAINSQSLTDMEIPESYIESLPKVYKEVRCYESFVMKLFGEKTDLLYMIL